MIEVKTVIDAESFAALESRCFDQPWTASDFKPRIPYVGAALWVDQVFTAYAYGTLIGEEAELFRVACHPDRRGKGHGLRVLLAFQVDCFENGARRLFLEVDANNLAALALYRKLGWQQTSRRKDYFGLGNDGLNMALTPEALRSELKRGGY